MNVEGFPANIILIDRSTTYHLPLTAYCVLRRYYDLLSSRAPLPPRDSIDRTILSFRRRHDHRLTNVDVVVTLRAISFLSS